MATSTYFLQTTEPNELARLDMHTPRASRLLTTTTTKGIEQRNAKKPAARRSLSDRELEWMDG